MDTVEILNQLVKEHQIIAYLLIFLGLVFEGEVVVITAGVLSYLGALDFRISLIFILAGGIVKTFGCYYLGILLHNRFNFSKIFRYIERRVMYFMPEFKEKPFWSIFISKFINGVNYIVTIFSGYIKVDFKTYLKAEFLSTFIWAPLLLSLGFFFSHTALSLTEDLDKFSFFIFLFLMIFLFFDKLVAAFYRTAEYFKNGLANGNNNENEKKQ